MAIQSKNARQVPSGRNSSSGAAVLDRPAIHPSKAKDDDRLQQEIARLVQASHEGRLSERGRSEQFEGNSRNVIEGVNRILDAILLPIGEGNRVLAQISSGKIDESISQTYNGDHEKMKQAINNVAAVLQGLQKELGSLTAASHAGLLTERGNQQDHTVAIRALPRLADCARDQQFFDRLDFEPNKLRVQDLPANRPGTDAEQNEELHRRILSIRRCLRNGEPGRIEPQVPIWKLILKRFGEVHGSFPYGQTFEIIALTYV